MRSLRHTIHAINSSTYKLDTSGVVGLFGGDSTVDALETIHLYAGRRWVGWYNYAGTVTVAKRFGQMADSRWWDSVFPGPNETPAVTFNLAGKSGPEYSGSFSGTKLRTGYLGYLIAEECMGSLSRPLQLFKQDGSEGRKTGSSASVSIVLLPPQQHERISQGLKMANVVPTKQTHEFIPIKSKRDPPLALLAIFPSLISILACVFSFLGDDPLCASLILFGIVASGCSSLALGAAALRIRVPVPSAGSPPGDGLMLTKDGSAIILKGEEADVNIITKGEFDLDYSNDMLPHQNYHVIGLTSLLLMTQFLVQLLLIPRCTFFGQILFLISFIASGIYHLYVVSHETESVHQELLFRELSARNEKWTLGTRTQMAVLVCLVLGDGRQDPQKSDPVAVLNRILPNDTPVWRYWKRKVSNELEYFWKWGSKSSLRYTPSIVPEPEDQTDIDEYSHFTERDKLLLADLIGDAWSVFNRYEEWRYSESAIGRGQGAVTEEILKTRPLSGDTLA